MEKSKKQMKYQAPALEKGLEILEFLASSSDPATQIDIARGINRNPNEIYRMLMCLDERGYISRDNVTGQYKMTLKLYNLSHCHSPVGKLRDTAKPFMKELSSYANQASHITVFHEDSLMIIAPTLSPGPISVSMEEGRTYPLLETTSGRLLLAQCKVNERIKILEGLKEYQRLSGDQQKEERELMEEVNKTRYLIRTSDITSGVTDIAAIIGKDDIPLKAVLSLCCIDSHLNKSYSKEELLEATIKTADNIAKAIGNI